MMEQVASSSSPRFNPSWILAAIVIVFTAYGVLLSWYLNDHSLEWLGPVLGGSWVFQAHLFAIWAALGPGAFLLRLPLVAAAFLIVVSAPGVHPDGLYERREFLALFLTATSIFAITTLLLLVIRWFVGWRIERQALSSQRDASRFQFNLRYLIVMVTLYAVALAIYTNIVYQAPEPPAFNIFGPDFVIRIIIFAGATMAGLLLPIMAVPLAILSTRPSKRAIYISLIGWAIITGAFAAFWQVVEGEGWELFLMALLAQVGAAAMGVLAALPLRLAGFRLERRVSELK